MRRNSLPNDRSDVANDDFSRDEVATATQTAIPTQHKLIDPEMADQCFEWLEVELAELEDRLRDFWTSRSVVSNIR